MNENKKLIIFDFDGVIVDSFKAIYPVVRDAFKSVGISLSEQGYRNFFLTNPKLAEKRLADNKKKFDRIQIFIHTNAPKKYRDVKIFPEIQKIIPCLSKNARLAIVSSSQTDIIKQKLKEYNLEKYFTKIFGADKDTSKIEKIHELIKHVNTTKKSTYFISDTVGDLKEGKNIGLATIAAIWGFHSRETLKIAQPDMFVSLENLQTLILNKINK